MMRIDGNSLSSGHRVQVRQLCESCNEPLIYPMHWCRSPHASSVEKVVAALPESSQEWARETLHQVLAEDGSSLTRRGARASRSWSATGSSGLVCRRIRRKKYDYIWGRIQSQLGMATGKTSDSLKSSTGEADIIGMAAPTPAERAG